jgi:hypothetical protein
MNEWKSFLFSPSFLVHVVFAIFYAGDEQCARPAKIIINLTEGFGFQRAALGILLFFFS